MHPRLSVSAVCSWRWSLEEDLAFWARAGIGQVGLSFRKLEQAGLAAARERVLAADLRVSNLLEFGHFRLAERASWPAQQERLLRALDFAAEVGAGSLVLTSGAPGRLGWEEAAAALGEALAPVARAATARGVVLTVENTSPLFLDLSFTTSLRDAGELASRLGIGLCVEVQSCFAERGLEDSLREFGKRIAHVQLSDYAVGSRSVPDRAVPGDGDIPLPAILAALAHVGYRGPFELELLGPRIEAEGYPRAIPRAVARAGELLDAAGF
jgi:sugar phosphate isomerase/epimerase